MSKAPHVTFSGLDGCGKSTQLEHVAALLEAEGARPVRLWSRGGYTPGVEGLKRLARRLTGRALPASGASKERTEALKRPLVARAWLAVAMLDLLRIYGLQVRWWRLTGRPVLCDRYLWDTLVDFRMAFPDEPIEGRLLWRLLTRVAARPDHAFLLTVPPAEGERRSLDKGDPFPEPLELRRRRELLYKDLVARGVFDVLDGSRPIESLFRDIEKALDS